MGRNEDLIVGLDIGTTKICVIVAERTENGVDVVGIGTHPSRGLRRGVVVDIDATVESIKAAVEEAELMADCEITSVYAGIAGGHIRAFNSHGVVAVKDREVRESDVKRVIDAAKAVAIETALASCPASATRGRLGTKDRFLATFIAMNALVATGDACRIATYERRSKRRRRARAFSVVVVVHG